MDNLEKTISELIRLKKEGGFWDYKSDYSDNKASFLHDIICMANNLENRYDFKKLQFKIGHSLLSKLIER